MKYLIIEFIFFYIVAFSTSRLINFGSDYWKQSKVIGFVWYGSGVGVFTIGLYVSLSYVATIFFNS